MRSVEDKVVVITGASKGIGLAAARAFAAAGACVVGVARSSETLKREFKRFPVKAGGSGSHLALQCDVTRPAEIRRVITRTVKRFGRIDIWVNNAGIGLHRPLPDCTDKDYTAIMDTNVRSVFHSFRELIPLFRRQGERDGLKGHIINISSSVTRVGVANLALYAASKSALNSLSESTANEVRNEGIKISVLAPASTDTDLMRNFVKPKKGARLSPSVAARKLTTEEVAEAILFEATQNPNAWTSMADIRPLSVKK